METNIDVLINFFRKHSPRKGLESDMYEQADTTSTATGAGSTGTQPSGKQVKKSETGLTRGKANQIGNTKWESGRKFGKTYMNDPKYVWKSDRNIGKTGGSDFV